MTRLEWRWKDFLNGKDLLHERDDYTYFGYMAYLRWEAFKAYLFETLEDRNAMTNEGGIALTTEQAQALVSSYEDA